MPGVAYPHRVRVRPLVVLPEEAWVPFEAFADKLEVVHHYPDFRSVVQQVLHPLPRVDEKVLEFLIRARAADLEQAMSRWKSCAGSGPSDRNRSCASGAFAIAPRGSTGPPPSKRS